MAQTTSSAGSPSAAASSSYNVFSAIASNSPNGGTYGVQPGNVASDPTNQAGQNAAGASGASDTSLNLSTGATVAIIVVVCLVVIIGASTAILFYLAKKRQWAVRDSLRRSVRRVTGRGNRPKTPRTGDPTLNRSKPRAMMRIDPPSATSKSRPHQQQEEEKTPILEESQRTRDVERGYKSQSQKNLKSAIQVTPALQSSFDMDSPRNAQTPGWAKVFGKK